MTLRAVRWAAVSDPSQLENDSIEQQLDRAAQIIAQRGWREVHEPLVVPGISRSFDFLTDALEAVPAMGDLLRLAREQAIDIVVCRHHNRLGRTAALVLQISAYLRRHKVQIFAFEAPVEPVPPAQLGRHPDTARLMVEGFAGLLSEADNNHRSQRNQDGMLTRIRRGGHPAGVAPYGYMDIISPDGIGRSHKKRVVSPAEYPVLCHILDLLKQGYSARHIEQLLAGDIDSRPPVKGRKGARISTVVILQWAQNPYYYGKTYRGWYPIDMNGKRKRQRREPLVLVDSQHECPMTWEDRAIILRNIAERDTVGPRWKRQKRPWTGLAYCGYCLEAGRAGFMRYRIDVKDYGRYEYLYCGHYSATGGRGCRRNGMRLADFLEALYGRLLLTIDNPISVNAMEHDQTAQPDQTGWLVREVEQLTDEEARWDSAYRAGIIDIDKYGAGLQTMRSRRQRLVAQLEAETRVREAVGQVRQQREEALGLLSNAIQSDDMMQISRLVRQIIQRVIVRDNELTIVWR